LLGITHNTKRENVEAKNKLYPLWEVIAFVGWVGVRGLRSCSMVRGILVIVPYLGLLISTIYNYNPNFNSLITKHSRSNAHEDIDKYLNLVKFCVLYFLHFRSFLFL